MSAYQEDAARYPNGRIKQEHNRYDGPRVVVQTAPPPYPSKDPREKLLWRLESALEELHMHGQIKADLHDVLEDETLPLSDRAALAEAGPDVARLIHTVFQLLGEPYEEDFHQQA